MADILFVTWDGGGNVPPAVGIAAELRRRGHGVRFVGHAAPARARSRPRASTSSRRATPGRSRVSTTTTR